MLYHRDVTRALVLVTIAACGRLDFEPFGPGGGMSDAGGDACATCTALIADWSFDESTGMVAHDASGHGNDLTLVGAPQWVEGHDGTALGLAGTVSWGATAAAPSLHLSPAFSIEAWAQITTYGAYRVIADKSSAAAFEYWLGYNPSDQACFLVNQGSLATENRIDTCTSTAITDAGWHHLVATYDGTVVAIYLDGLANTATQSLSDPPYADTNPVLVGHSTFWNYNPWDGDLDTIRIYQRVLTASEIANPDAR